MQIAAVSDHRFFPTFVRRGTGRHGVFLEEGASFNSIINNTCLYNKGAGISEGSAAAGPTSDNIALANVLHAVDQAGGFALDVGGGQWSRRTNDFVAVGNDCAGGASGTHGMVNRGIFSLNKRCKSESSSCQWMYQFASLNCFLSRLKYSQIVLPTVLNSHACP